MLDCIIVGHGIAGALLSYRLQKAGLTVRVFDGGDMTSCSSVAAGVINPVTGRRFVKSWKIESLIEEARKIYRELEHEFGISLIHSRRIRQYLRDSSAEKQWLMRTGDPEYARFLQPDILREDSTTMQYEQYGIIQGGFQVDLPDLVGRYAQLLEKERVIEQKHFDPEKLRVTHNGVAYQGLRSRRIVFCDGAAAQFNPWFNWLPFEPAKGELLLCRIPQLNTEDILKGSVTIVPTKKDIYWVGSTYAWDFQSDEPTAEGRTLLERRLGNMLNTDFEVVDHLAAVRPSTDDRRPFVGFHPDHPAVGIVNGLGTKGASLAPYCTGVLANVVLNGGIVDREVHIFRHWPR